MSSAKRLAQEILDTRRLALGHATSPQLTSSAIDGGGIDFRDADGNPIAGIGVGDDGGFIIDYSGGPKPPKPSPPTVTADAGIFRIEWDGSFVNEGDEGILATSDTDRVEVHASMDENFVPDRVESFGGAFATLDGGSFTLGPLPEAGTYYFRLVARSKSAQFSEPSERVEQALAITSIDLEVIDAWLTGEAAQTTADGKNSIWRGPDEPVADPDAPFKDGDIWFEMTEDGKSIPNIWDETTGAWVGNDDYRQSEIERVQQELREDLDAIVVDGSGAKNFYRGTMPTDAESSEGDLWFDSSDSNKPYIYQNGEWITVRDSFTQPGAGENVFALLDESGSTPHAIDNQWSNVAGYEIAPGSYGAVATVPDGAAAGTATLRVPLTGSFNSAGEWQITEDDVFESNGLGLGAKGSFDFYSPGAAPTARIVLNVLVPGTGLIEAVQDLEVKEYIFGSSQTHSMSFDEQSLAVMGVYPTVYAWSLFLELNVDSVPGNTVEGSVMIAYAVGGQGISDNAITETKISDDSISTPKLQSKVITTDKIATGAITAESGIIGSINAGTVTVGEMNGARIKANTIASDRILVGTGGNLISWDQVARGETYAPHGIYGTSGISLNLAPSDAAKARPAHLTVRRTAAGFSYSVYLKGGVDRKIPASPKTEYTFSCSFYSEDAGAQARVVLVGYSDFNAANGSGSGYIGQIAQSEIVNLTGDTQRVTVKGTTQANAVAVVPWIQVSSGQLIGVIDPVLKNTIGATLIEGGAITTEHIRTGAITAESGIIGSIDANVITVGKIMGNQLDADAINGKTITGATIRTASSGSRVELTHNGLKQYNSLGATIVDMTAGSFTLQGGSITGSTFRTATSGGRVEIDSNGFRSYAPDGKATTVIDSATGTVGIQGTLAVPSADLMMEMRGFGSAGHPGLLFTGPESVFGRSSSSGIGTVGNAGRILTSAYGSGLEISGPRNSNYDAGAWIALSPREDGKTSGMYVPTSRGNVGIFATTSFYGEVLVGTSSGKNGGPDRIADLTLTRDGTGPQVYSKAIYNRDYTTSSANVYVTSFGTLGRASSARRYKAKEQVIDRGSYEDALLSVDYKSWLDKEQLRLHEEYLRFREYHPIEPVPAWLGEAPQEPPSRVVGAIAEDFVDAGLPELVQFDEFGQTQGINYDRIGVALIPIIRDLRDRVEELEAQLAS